MGYLALNLASLYARGLGDPSKCARLLGELSNLSVDVAAVQETHFTCAADCRVLENENVVLSAHGSCSSDAVSLLIGCSLNADVNLALADDGGRVVAVYAPNTAVERVSFYRRLAPFFDNSKRLVLMGDWNTILDSKIDRVERGAKESKRCKSNLINFMAGYNLINRFRLDHLGRKMWTLLSSSPSVRTKSYLERVLEELTLILSRVPRSLCSEDWP